MYKTYYKLDTKVNRSKVKVEETSFNCPFFII